MKSLRWLTTKGLVLAIVAGMSLPARSWGDDPPIGKSPDGTPAISEKSAAPSPDSTPLAEAAWRNQVNEAKAARNLLYGGGGAGAIGGVALLAVGIGETNQASHVQGCSQSGSSDIICDSEPHRQEAQDKLDSGRLHVLAGLGVGLVGAAMIVWANFKSSDVKSLERQGQQKGFRLALEPRDEHSVVLLAKYAF